MIIINHHLIIYYYYHAYVLSNSLFLLLVIPSTRSVKFGNDLPKINNSFIAQSASVIGKVEIGSGSSVWYGAVVRGNILLYIIIYYYY